MKVSSPHSLGTLIEWKLFHILESKAYHYVQSPHSLGTLIEWKLPELPQLFQ